MNAIRGEIEVPIEGKNYTLRFTWDDLAAMEAAHGDNPNLFDVETVASIAALGFHSHHPELTAARIKELSPPLLPFAQTVQTALQWAYFGPEGIPEESEKAKKKPDPKEDGFWAPIARRWRKG